VSTAALWLIALALLSIAGQLVEIVKRLTQLVTASQSVMVLTNEQLKASARLATQLELRASADVDRGARHH
jgi:hypothetical protein